MTYEHTKEDYEALVKAYVETQYVCNGRPDRYQAMYNDLCEAICLFIVKPYQAQVDEDHNARMKNLDKSELK